MLSRSVKLLLVFHFAVTLLSLRLTDVQALSIPDVVVSLANRRSLESITDEGAVQMKTLSELLDKARNKKSVTFLDDGTITDEESQLKVLSELLDKARNKKSVTFQDEDFGIGDDEKKRDVNLKRFLDTKLAPSLEKLKRAIFLKHSYSGVDRDAKQHQDTSVQLKDRDYFQAIGIAPGGYDSNPYAYSSNRWSNYWGYDDYY